MPLNLSQEERYRFIAWLEQEAEQGDIMAEQLAKISGPDLLAKKYRVESMACRVIAKLLRSIHTETIGG